MSEALAADAKPAAPRWRRHVLAAVLLAVASHALVVWALPRLIMARLDSGLAAQPVSPQGTVLPAVTDHRQRAIVLPSPDLLYALCRVDLRPGPLRVQADPRWPHYWSLALYADNSDNLLVVNDQQAAGQPVDWLLTGPGQAAAAPNPPTAGSSWSTAAAAPEPASTPRPITLPSQRGLLLMRLLLADPEHDLPAAEAARQRLRCGPA